MTRCYAYLRVSGVSQVEGDGFDRQLLTIERYAEKQGIEIVQVFREEGVSGTKDLDGRPAFLAMLDALLADGVKTVLIERLDRLARSLMIQENILREMKTRGFSVVSATEPDLDDEDPTRTFIRQILGAVAQFEKSQIVAKLRGARQRKKSATGRCEGQKPFGFYEQERPALEEILRQRDALGFSAKRIAEELNAGGFVPRRGKTWHPQVVVKILRANGRVV